MDYYHNGVTKKVLKFVPESTHVIRVTLDGRSSLQDWEGITTKGNVFIIPPPPLICVREVTVLLHLLYNPLRKRDPEK